MPEPTAAPSAPTPAPASTTPSPVTSTPDIAPSPPIAKPSYSSAFDEIDKIASGVKDKPEPAQRKEAAPKNPTEKSAQVADKPSDATKDASASEQSDSTKDASKTGSTDKQPEKPFKAAELRTAYENLKKKTADLERELTTLKTSKPADDPEKKVLAERLTEREKRLKELEEQVKYSNYESTEEYKTKYEKPFIDAFQAGRRKVESLKVTDGEGNVRQGTPQDFDSIMRQSDDDAAAEKAAEMFGSKAAIVLYHRERVQELNRSREDAIAEFRNTAAERDKSRIETEARSKAEQDKQRENNTQMFLKQRTEDQEKYPQWFKPVEGDDEGNKLLENGEAQANRLFMPPADMTPEQTVKFHAAIWNKVRAFDRLAVLHKRASEKVAALETELKEFKASVPDGGTDKRAKAASDKVLSFEDEIDALASATR